MSVPVFTVSGDRTNTDQDLARMAVESPDRTAKGGEGGLGTDSRFQSPLEHFSPCSKISK
jgi:hypothetical protein